MLYLVNLKWNNLTMAVTECFKSTFCFIKEVLFLYMLVSFQDYAFAYDICLTDAYHPSQWWCPRTGWISCRKKKTIRKNSKNSSLFTGKSGIKWYYVPMVTKCHTGVIRTCMGEPFRSTLIHGTCLVKTYLCPFNPHTYTIKLNRKMSCDMTEPTKWVCAQQRLRSAWASTQSDQSLHCALNG